MKYAVTVETEVEFDFADNVDQKQLLKEFCDTIFKTNMLGLHRFIAEQIVLGDRTFIEGVGPITDKFWKDTEYYTDSVLYFDIKQFTTDVEEL